MLQGTTDDVLSEQLLRIAREPDLRRMVYDRLGDYCHHCRNRLNSLKLSLYLAMRHAPPDSDLDSDGLWDEIDRHYRDLERRVERVQALCRPLTLSRVTLGLDLLIDDRREAWGRSVSKQGRELELELVAPAERAVASFDVERMGQALDSLVSWRASDRSTEGRASLRWWVEAGYAHFAWEEPPSTGGPSTGKPSVEEDEARWTLPMLARVALAHDGDLVVSEDRGWRLEVSWPSLPPSP